MLITAFSNSLIGDCLGSIPAIIALSKKHTNVKLSLVGGNSEGIQLYKMIPTIYGIKLVFDNEQNDDQEQIHFDLLKAHDAFGGHLHMTQAHFASLGLDIPPSPVRPELEFPDIDVPLFDYILVPFSRCNPIKWPQDNWNKLVDRMPDKTFAVFGNEMYDPYNYISKKTHIKDIYSRPLKEVANIMVKARHGIVSNITGISHLAHALGCKNFLFNTQAGAWGVNPDAIKMPLHYTPEQVQKTMEENEGYSISYGGA